MVFIPIRLATLSSPEMRRASKVPAWNISSWFTAVEVT